MMARLRSNPYQESDKGVGHAGATDAIDSLGEFLDQRVRGRIGNRTHLEERWIDDIRQVNGVLSEQEKARLKTAGKSQAFIKLTRQKVNTGVARLYDMLFPTDDKSWGIRPTPNPEMSSSPEDREEPVKTEEGASVVSPEGQPVTAEQAKQSMTDLAKRKSEGMEKTIHDQLVEDKFGPKIRDGIEVAAIFGTIAIKGPFVRRKERRSWAKQSSEEATAWMMDRDTEIVPAMGIVQPWNIFPPDYARSIEDCGDMIERIFLSKRDLRKLAKTPGYIASQIARVLETDAGTFTDNNFLQNLRSISDQNWGITDNRYEAFEFHGDLEHGDLVAADFLRGKDHGKDENPLEVPFSGKVVWCNGIVICVRPEDLEADDLIYDIFCWEKDHTSLFGFGIPYMGRHSQRSLNGAWRMCMDNGGLASGGQLIVDQNIIEPNDGSWVLRARKLWLVRKNTSALVEDVRRAFTIVDIPSRLNELLPLVEWSLRLFDIETGIPLQAQGETSPLQSKTPRGMSYMQGNLNAGTRRQVRNWDDDVISRFITRYYYWNMQFHPNDEIKGDLEVYARGTSVLVAREIQAESMAQAIGFISHPVLGPIHRAYRILREYYKSIRLDPSDVLKDEDEAKELLKQISQQSQDNPDIRLRTAELELRREEIARNVEIAQLNYQAALAKIAADKGISVDKLTAQVQVAAMKEDGADDRYTREAQLKREEGSGI